MLLYQEALKRKSVRHVKFPKSTHQTIKPPTMSNVLLSSRLPCETAKWLESLKQNFYRSLSRDIIFCIYFQIDLFLQSLPASLWKYQNITTWSFSLEIRSLIFSAYRPVVVSENEAQGWVRCNKDRLGSSRRQRDKDLQLQLKSSTAKQKEMVDFLPVQHYYRPFPGERRIEEPVRGQSGEVNVFRI